MSDQTKTNVDAMRRALQLVQAYDKDPDLSWTHVMDAVNSALQPQKSAEAVPPTRRDCGETTHDDILTDALRARFRAIKLPPGWVCRDFQDGVMLIKTSDSAPVIGVDAEGEFSMIANPHATLNLQEMVMLSKFLQWATVAKGHAIERRFNAMIEPELRAGRYEVVGRLPANEDPPEDGAHAPGRASVDRVHVRLTHLMDKDGNPRDVSLPAGHKFYRLVRNSEVS